MPIYEFCCNQCGTAFEELVRNGTRPECPQCHSQNLTEKFMGQLIVVDAEKSEIGKKLDIKMPGRYAIKLSGH